MSTVTVYMTAERFWTLLSKKISEEASPEELKEFDDLLNNHPDWKDSAEKLAALWHQPVRSAHDEAAKAYQAHAEKMKQLGVAFNDRSFPEIEPPQNNISGTRTKRWLVLVSLLTVIAAVFFLVRFYNSSNEIVALAPSPINQVRTPPASKTQVQLPDGSRVRLNASSNLTYDKDFGKNLREVNLTGEAFFDVVKDPEHPFIIHTKVIDVKVLGTQFNVKAYPNDAYTETSLIKGSVEITVKNRPNEKHFLKPNEKVSVANNINQSPEKSSGTKPSLILTESLTHYHGDSTIIETSWLDNKLVFQENETFAEVALKMERWYGVHISFADEKVKEYRIYGSFTTETITQALDALKEVFKFSYKRVGNDIIITE